MLNIAKVALVSFAALGMAAPVFAETTGDMTGRAYTYFTQSTSKASSDADSVTTMGMAQYTVRLGYSVSTTEGEWTGTAKSEIQVSESHSPAMRDNWVALENESMKIKFGRAWHLGSSEADYAAHNGTFSSARFTALAYSPKGIENLSLTALLSLGNGKTLFGATDATDNTDQTAFGVDGSYSAGAIGVGFAFGSGTSSANVNQGGTEGYKQTATLMGLKVTFAVDDAMTVGLSYNDQKISTTASDGADAVDSGHNNIMLWGAYNLGDSAEVYAGYEMETDVVVSGADAKGHTGILLGYDKTIASIGVNLEYTVVTGTGANEDTNNTLALYMSEYF